MRVTDPLDTDAVLDYLAGRLAPDLELQLFADLLDSLCWTVDDNGAQIEATRERWLREGDRVRTHTAALMSDVYPGFSREEVVANVEAAAARFPELRARAQEIVGRWDRAHQDPVEPLETATGFPVRAVSGAGAVEAVTMAGVLDFLADHRAPNMPPDFMTENIDDLIRCLSPDAVADVLAACDAWRAGGDPWRAAAAAGVTAGRDADQPGAPS